MKGIVYRSAALVLALVVVCSALAVPSFATDYQSTYNFWNWAYDNSWFLGKAIIGFSAGNVCQVSEDGLHHAITHSGGGGSVDGQRVYNCVCDLCGQEFQAVATDLEGSYNDTVFNTDIKSVNSDNLIDFSNWQWHDVIGNAMKVAQGIDYVSYLYSANQSINWSAWTVINLDTEQTVYVTKVGYYSLSTLPEQGSFTTSQPTIYYKEGNKQVNPTVSESDEYYSFSAVAGREYFISINLPNTLYRDSAFNLTGVTETFYCDYPSVYIKSSLEPLQRPNVFSPSFTYEDGDGKETVSDQQIIDEQGLIYYNPVTNTTTNITNWTYDYSDRSYTCTTENNTTTTITYGDEFITINEGDVNNTYITYNIYYYTAPEDSGDGSDSGSDGEGSGSSGSGDSSDDGDGIGGGLGELLGSLLGGLIDLITGLISGLIDSLINLVEMTIEKLGQVVNLFGEFGDALKVLWSWLPDEVVTILAAGVSVVVFASVIKLFV